MKSATETEVKIRLASRDDALEKLRHAGLTVSVERTFESNTVYDTADKKLERQRMLLRLRQVGSECILTWKGPGEPGRYKSRPELETSIGSCETLDRIFLALGYKAVFRYEKYRTEFTRANSPGVVTLDETPIGDFLELEGPGEWIDSTARELSFAQKDYILESYGRLYVADCERRGAQPTHMVFASHASADSR